MQTDSEAMLTDLGPDRLRVLAALRKLLGVALSETPAVVSRLPLKLGRGSLSEMAELKRSFEELGASVLMRPARSGAQEGCNRTSAGRRGKLVLNENGL